MPVSEGMSGTPTCSCGISPRNRRFEISRQKTGE